MTGDRSFNPGDFDEKEFGLTLGGPIMQDTLFAFVSIDKFESTSTADFSQFDASRGIQPGFFEALARRDSRRLRLRSWWSSGRRRDACVF